MKTNCKNDIIKIRAWRGHYPVVITLSPTGECDIEYHNVSQISPPQHAGLTVLKYCENRDELPDLQELRKMVFRYKKIVKKIKNGMTWNEAIEEIDFEFFEKNYSL